ncbi:hypothetical protein CgunFtcFv8_008993 [Champsocephalus gunnari]|uniref:Uncharacterized protein n=1 Tax=Champsocephalus gunnari TaxID=52237 RepID=A0AAN8D4X7_CHAGU|nr:hypothetical protein CgunFtcFv8_008993 [Champsocephalus gunnari]
MYRPLISIIQDYIPPAKTPELHPTTPPPPTPTTTSLAGLSSTSMLHPHPHPLSTPPSGPCPSPITPLLGFPGMGYGMGMPPFPPPNPYMEVPAYIMPRPDMQPVDYRRFIHPQAQAPSVAYQNPYQPCRVRPHHTDPVRETVNSAVQTEPQQRGRGFSEESPLISADSGSGTAINSPSSSSSSSQKQNSAEVENDALHSSNEKDLPVKETSNKHGFNVLQPTGTTAIQSCIRANPGHSEEPKREYELLQSSSHKLPDNEQDYSIETNPFEDMAPITPSINNGSYLKRTWNESIWSVESLAPFIPTEEWLQRDDLLAADVIVEQAENDNPIVKSSPTKEDKNRSSEPEANQSPNQDILNEQLQKKRTSPPQQEESLNLNSIEKTCARKLNLQNGAGIQVEDGALWKEEVSLLGKEQLGVPMADQKTAEVSPSKVDFGVQCNEFQEHKCACEERRCSMGPNRNQTFTYSENKNGNYRQGEGPVMRGQTQKNQRKQGNRKPRGQGGSQHEACSGYYGKPGKRQGGNGHNPPY